MEEGQKITFKMVCASQFNPVWKFLLFLDIHILNYAEYISIIWLHIYICTTILYKYYNYRGCEGLKMANTIILGPDFFTQVMRSSDYATIVITINFVDIDLIIVICCVSSLCKGLCSYCGNQCPK